MESVISLAVKDIMNFSTKEGETEALLDRAKQNWVKWPLGFQKTSGKTFPVRNHHNTSFMCISWAHFQCFRPFLRPQNPWVNLRWRKSYIKKLKLSLKNDLESNEQNISSTHLVTQYSRTKWWWLWIPPMKKCIFQAWNTCRVQTVLSRKWIFKNPLALTFPAK